MVYRYRLDTVSFRVGYRGTLTENDMKGVKTMTYLQALAAVQLGKLLEILGRELLRLRTSTGNQMLSKLLLLRGQLLARQLTKLLAR